MTLPPLARMLMLVATMAIGSGIDTRASDSVLPFPHIRTVDPQIRALIDDAMETSATVRALVERISASDVVVYVACERDPGVRAGGRLNFITSAGGFRYVVIRLKPKRRAATIAMLAHELQHAAEIADLPTIIDEESLARAYARIGYRSPAMHGGMAFDTSAAVETGRRVLEEVAALRAGTGD